MKHRPRPRKGQSEVVGGLIVLTLIFLFAVPVILNVYYANIKAGQEARLSVSQAVSKLNEKISVGPMNPNSPAAVQAGWQVAVWINNTGTTSVTLDKLYLVDISNNSIFAVFDLRYARPVNNTYIKHMFIDFEQGVRQGPPPAGEPIVLAPGQTLLIVFNESILPEAPNLVALVESDSGLLHPLVGGGAPKPIYPGRPSKAAAAGAWRGIFAPQSGFKLMGYDQIKKFSNIWVERPCYRFYWSGRSYGGWAISNDENHPPYYKVEFDEWGYPVYLETFLGTFDWDPDDTSLLRVDGWYGGSSGCRVRVTDWDTFFWDHSYGARKTWKAFTYSDMDFNGVKELTFFTYWIHYYGGYDWNPDSDGDGDLWYDSVVGMVQIARDISGVDFIKVSSKVIYDISILNSGAPSNPMKVFSFVIWKYYPEDNSWRIVQAKDFEFIDMGPKTFEVSAIFPVNRTGTYRVGVVFYDPYMKTYGGAFYEFMMGLEHIIVEYGVLNPLFVESPPLYIVAIPEPDLIGDIGEEDYALSHNLTDLDEAKVQAQADLLAKIKEELNYAGIAGYTVINTPEDFCNLLFTGEPPKFAVIYWLQGNVSVEEVAARGGCSLTPTDLKNYLRTNHWILVWPFGEPFGDRTLVTIFNSGVDILPEGNYTLNITRYGLDVRKDYYAYFLFNSVPFQYAVKFDNYNVLNASLIPQATFYANGTINESTTIFGTIAFWLDSGEGTGAIVLNPVHIDWDLTGDGVTPDTLAQQIVYSSAIAWTRLVSP